MPIQVGSNNQSTAYISPDVAQSDQGYVYPGGLDLRPSSDLHKKLVDMVMKRARDSYDVMSARHDVWKKIDLKLTAFIDTDEKERKVKADDSRKPISMVVPMSYSMTQTLLTYWVSAFTQDDTLYHYDWTGPEDKLGTILLERVLRYQCIRRKHLLEAHTMWRDGIVYGIGAVTPVWTQEIGKKSVPLAMGFFEQLFGMFKPKSFMRNTVNTLLYEGNDLYAIDPYLLLLDPNVPIHRAQKGQFIGWLEKTNRMNILSEEDTDDSYFNARYTKLMKGFLTSSIYDDTLIERDKRSGFDPSGITENDVVHRIHMYMTIIPRDLGLSESDRPEKWLFTVIADKLLTRAQPLGLDHNMYPIALCAPEFDGHTATPISSIELTYGQQEAADWMLNTHITNIRKALNDMFIVDPYKVDMEDLRHPGPGKLIKLRRSAWGSGVEGAIKQFPVVDVTGQNLAGIQMLENIMADVTGASDAVRGVQRRTSERITAKEVQSTMTAAISRIEKGARMGAIMAHQDLAYMCASHTQQFMTKDTFVRTTGRWEDVLRGEFGLPPIGAMGIPMDRMQVRPIDIMVDFDVLPIDPRADNQNYVEGWLQSFQILGSSPELAAQFDVVRIFKHLARLMGAKDVNDFIRRAPPIVPSVIPDQLVQQRIDSGRYIPVSAATDMSGAA